jgi:signal transduction histidine kinase/ligand-binding sensor domain-containing protein
MVVLLLLCSFVSTSQISKYEFKQISLSEGLSQSSVYSIFQDSKGFMWFGTSDGLNRFDGRNISVLSDSQGKEFLRGSIRGIDEGTGGKLYLATNGMGLKTYNINNGNIKSYLPADSKNSLMSSFLNSVLYADENTVWMASNKGVSRFNPQTEKFRNYRLPAREPDKEPVTGAVCLFKDKNSDLWVGTEGVGLLIYIKDEERFIPFVNKTDGGNSEKKNFVNSLVEYRDGLFLVATDDGLFLFDPQTGIFWKYLINNVELLNIAKDQFGGVWIASRHNGLYHIDKDEQLEILVNNQYDLKSIPDNQLLSVYKDNMQNVWIGSRTKGVVQINLEKKPFANLYHVPNKHSIANNSVYAIEEDDDGNVWVGTAKGLTVWNRKSNNFKQIGLRLFNKKIKYDISVWSLLLDSNNIVWIGTNSGLIRYNIKTGQHKHYFNQAGNVSSLLCNDVSDIEKDKNNDLWISTPEGVSRLNRKDNTFIRYTSKDSVAGSLSHNKVWDIFCDTKGRLWFSTSDGLDLYNYEKDDFSVLKFSNSDFNRSNILSNGVMSIREAADGNLWVTTRSGVFILDSNSTAIKGVVKIVDEFSDELVYELLESSNSFWASTNSGLIVIDKESYNLKSRYSVEDGLCGNEFNSGASCRLSDGAFIFGGIDGASLFYPRSIKKSEFCPPVYFTGISLYGKEVSPENPSVWERASFEKNIISASKITFTPDEKMFALKFAALDYVNPNRVSFFYRILPVSDEWITLGKQNFINFINLNAGNYTLEIKSTNGDGILCDNTCSIELIVTPPVWKKWWFMYLGIFIIASLAFLIFRLRVLRLRREKRKLEKIVNIRTREIKSQRNIANKQRDEIARQKEELQDFAAELEYKVRDRTKELEAAKLKAEESDRLKSAFLSNMSHEIRTPMNAIIGFSDLLLTTGFDEAERISFANMVKSNGDALLSLLNDIIDVSMIESGQLKLHFVKVDVCNLINDIFLSFTNSKQLKEKINVKLVLSTNISGSLVINTDVNRMRQVVNNLLGNSIKFTDKGSIKLGCEEDNDRVIFYVKDTGIGISEEYKGKIFNRFYKLGKDDKSIYGGNGLGLTISKNLVEALNGEIWFESEEGVGTTFFVSFPKDSQV